MAMIGRMDRGSAALGACRRNPPRAMRRVQLRGGARWPHAGRTRVGGVRGHVWAPQTKVRRPACLARYVARRSEGAVPPQMGPYLRSGELLRASTTRLLASRAAGQRAARARSAPRRARYTAATRRPRWARCNTVDGSRLVIE